MLFRQLFDPVSSTSTYLLDDEGTRRALLIDAVFGVIRARSRASRTRAHPWPHARNPCARRSRDRSLAVRRVQGTRPPMGSLLKTILSLVAITATSRESARTTYSAVPSGAMANPSGSSMEALKLTAIPRTQQIPHALGLLPVLANQGVATTS